MSRCVGATSMPGTVTPAGSGGANGCTNSCAAAGEPNAASAAKARLTTMRMTSSPKRRKSNADFANGKTLVPLARDLARRDRDAIVSVDHRDLQDQRGQRALVIVLLRLGPHRVGHR